jgi:N-acetylglucosamine-6-phosphate deacetylase
VAQGDILLKNGAVVLADTVLFKSDVLIKEGKIAEVGPDLRTPRGAKTVNASGYHIAPGFIDVHIHGASGNMFEFADAEGYRTIASTIARHGTTGFLATLAVMPIRTAVEFAHEEGEAKLLGIHMEGPYISAEMPGAQNVMAIRKPDLDELQEYLKAAEGKTRLMTLAPEIEGALELIPVLRENGIIASAGHSNATFEEMRQAVQAGLTHVSHTYNAMRPLHHREPGAVGAALAMDLLSTEVICDGQHVAPAALDVLLRCKPREKVVLITDAVAALGLPEGEHDFLGMPVEVKGGAVRLKNSQNLAGSVLTQDVAIRNLFTWFPKIPLREIFLMASLNPAKAIGIDEHKGQIAVGKDADIILMDESFEVALTIVEGRIVYTGS